MSVFSTNKLTSLLLTILINLRLVGKVVNKARDRDASESMQATRLDKKCDQIFSLFEC